MARRWSAMLAMAGLLGLVLPITTHVRSAQAAPTLFPPIAYNVPDPTTTLGSVALVNPDGSGAQPVSLPGLIDPEGPVWSRDGRVLAATAVPVNANPPQQDVFVFDPAGNGVRDITNLALPTAPCGKATQPLVPAWKAFSPDTSSLAYVAYEICQDPNLGRQMYFALRINSVATGLNLAEVGIGTFDAETAWGLDWSTQNQLVLPISYFDPSTFTAATDLFSGSPNGGSLGSYRRITYPPAVSNAYVADIFPSYSPDGTRIAFARWVQPLVGLTSLSIDIVDAAGGNERTLASFTDRIVSHIGWSPDGTNLVFDLISISGTTAPEVPLKILQGTVPLSSFRGLWTIGADGSGLTRIVSTPAWAPAWAPSVPMRVLPALSNGAYGGFVTSAFIQNVGAAPASVNILYLDQNGLPVGAGDAVTNLPANATWIVSQSNGHSFASGHAGSAIVMSNQPLAGFVNEFAPGGGDATSYTGVSPGSGVGTTLFAPAIANNAYGGYTTGIGLMNAGTVATNLTITYRNSAGSVVKTQTLNGVAAGAYQALYSGDAALGLPDGFAGTATITSSAGSVAAIVNETGPGNQFSSYDAVPAGNTTLDAPVALNNAYGGYNTGMAIQNTTGSAGTVTINYYDPGGVATTKTFPIAANGYLGVYQGTDIPVAGAYTAKITSTVGIAAIVNEVAPSPTAAKQSTAYNTFASGAASVHLPLVESAGSDGWSTGEGIMNTGTAATTVTVTYYDTVTGAPMGTPQSLLLQPNAFWGLYQPAGGLPTGMRASAVVNTSAGGQVAVICNESNLTTFMSYNGG